MGEDDSSVTLVCQPGSKVFGCPGEYQWVLCSWFKWSPLKRAPVVQCSGNITSCGGTCCLGWGRGGENWTFCGGGVQNVLTGVCLVLELGYRNSLGWLMIWSLIFSVILYLNRNERCFSLQFAWKDLKVFNGFKRKFSSFHFIRFFPYVNSLS